jgi:beta-fructofuranosidase
MGDLSVKLDAGDVLHVWQKTLEPAATSKVEIRQCDGATAILSPPRSADFARTTYEARLAGPVTLQWDATATQVSLVYAFHPGRAIAEGIRVHLTRADNRPISARYRLHLRPPFGWMNDPNGCCETGGLTHVFYQHYPHSLRWNTMHWGHAVSANLIDWVHLPVFLDPRGEMLADAGRKGGAFSGSAIPEANGALRIFYTDHEDRREPEMEVQMTALSVDLLSAGPAAPVIETRPPIPGLRRDNRDPYVFKGADGLWKMLLGSADEQAGLVLLYESRRADGAADWSFAGVLHREPLTSAVPAECPCLIALDGDGAGLFVLVFGLIGLRDPATLRRNLSVMIVGRFDGRRFEEVTRRELDFGSDCYAFQSFAHHAGPHGIAWAANWTDVFRDRDYSSAMIFPRRLLWRSGALLTPPAEMVSGLRASRLATDDAMLAAGLPLPGGLAELSIEFRRPSTPFRLELAHATHEIALIYDGATLELLFEPPGHRVVPRYLARAVAMSRLQVFIDVGLIEIFADDGRWCATKRIDSDEPVTSIKIQAERADVERIEAWRLRPQQGGLE